MIAEGVSCSLTVDDKLPSTQVLCLSTPDGDRSFVSMRGAAEALRPEDIDYTTILNSKAFLFDGFSLYSPFAYDVFLETRTITTEKNILLAFNPGNLSVIEMRPEESKSIADKSNILICNLAEVRKIYGIETLQDAAGMAEKKHAGAITDGEHGCGHL